MTLILRFLAGVFLLLSATSVLAHGDEDHGGQSERPIAAESDDGQSVHENAIDGRHVSSETSLDHDSEQDHESGMVGALKSLHPATVHFPIALFITAALTELFVLSRRTPEREAAVRIMLYAGAAGSVVAVFFGWIHTGLWFGGDTVMQLHRWNGMLIAALGLASAWVAYRRSDSRIVLRVLVFSIALLLIVQGFMGGELAHGPNHLKL